MKKSAVSDRREISRIGWRDMIALFAMMLSAVMACALTPKEAVSRFAGTPRLPQGSMAVLVTELPTGKVLASYNADHSLMPASIMKCISIASLSETMDMEQPILTPVFVDADIDADGVLEGNIIVVGQGDPSVNSKIWPVGTGLTDEITEALRHAGVKSVKGDIIVDDSYFKGDPVPPTWASADLPHSYGTGSHAFNYANNSSGKSSVKNPAAAFRIDLRRKLAEAGISIGDEPLRRGPDRELLLHASPELKEIMRSCMMRSDNLYAETALRLFGKADGGDGSTEDAARREREFWQDRRLNLNGVRIIDGSGLSRSNRMTARFMENVLRDKSGDVEYVSFFPLAGQEGTLKKLLADTPLDSYLAMKTGSMKGIQCYAGYKLDDDFAPTHVVVVMVNDFKCDRAYLRAQVEKMLLEIFSDDNITNKKFTNPQKNIKDYAN